MDCFPKGLCHFTFQGTDGSCHFSTSLMMLLCVSLFDDTRPRSVRRHLIRIVISLSPTNYDAEHVFIGWSAVCICSMENCLFTSFPLFSIGSFTFSLLSFYGCLYILDTRPLSDIWLANIIARAVSCFFTFLIVSFEIQKFLVWMKSRMACFLLWLLMLLVSELTSHCLIQECRDINLCFFSKSFIIFALTFLVFICPVR